VPSDWHKTEAELRETYFDGRARSPPFPLPPRPPAPPHFEI